MRRTSATGHVANKFSAGNPGLGILPTELDPDWHNSVQEEIATVIEDEAGGDAAIDPEDDGQLLAAIQAMIARATAPHVTQIGETKEFLVAGAWDTDVYEELAGQTRDRADYPALWALVSASGNLAADGPDKVTNRTKWGRGDGIDTFEFPDMRGIFRRVSKGALVSSIIPAVGVFKGNQNKEHNHTLPSDVVGSINRQALYQSSETDESDTGDFTGDEGGDEACPDHTTVYYVIRVK